MKKVIAGVLVTIISLGLCAVIGLLAAGPVVERVFNQVAAQNVLAEYNIPMSPDLIFQKKEENPKGGNLNEIPMFNVERDFQWSEAEMSFVDSLQASNYTILQFLFKKKTEQLSNPQASTAEGIRNEVVDFYMEQLLKNGWTLVLLPGYNNVPRYSSNAPLYFRGETAPLMFQNSKDISQLLILDSKRGVDQTESIRTATINGQNMPVYWLVLYTNPKITKTLPALTKLHGEKYVDTKNSEFYLELLENQIFMMQLTSPVVGKYTIESGSITLTSPSMMATRKGSITSNKITFTGKGISDFSGEFVKE